MMLCANSLHKFRNRVINDKKFRLSCNLVFWARVAFAYFRGYIYALRGRIFFPQRCRRNLLIGPHVISLLSFRARGATISKLLSLREIQAAVVTPQRRSLLARRLYHDPFF